MQSLRRRDIIRLLASSAVTLLSTSLSRPTVLHGQGVQHLTFVVAHQDDDILFMNPDLQDAILKAFADPMSTVTTIYMTCGCVGQDPNLSETLAREAGIMRAYAYMALKEENAAWTDDKKWGLSYREFVAYPNIRMFFMRLPAQREQGGHPAVPNDLGTLWFGKTTLSPVDQSAPPYTRDSLIQKLGFLIQTATSTSVAMLDPTSSNFATAFTHPKSVVCPADCRHPVGPNCDYFYDHHDHYYSAQFVLEACVPLDPNLQVSAYRTYNIMNEAENVPAPQGGKKFDAAKIYADTTKGLNVCRNAYWVRRQYRRWGPLPLRQVR